VEYTVQICYIISLLPDQTDDIISKGQFKIQLKIDTAKSPTIISERVAGKCSHRTALKVSQT
jgi:hypothetical protein